MLRGPMAEISARRCSATASREKAIVDFSSNINPLGSVAGGQARGPEGLIDRIDRYPDPGPVRPPDRDRTLLRHQTGTGRLRERLERADPPYPARVQAEKGPDPDADLFGICCSGRERRRRGRSAACCRNGTGFVSIPSRCPLRSRAWTWPFSAIRTTPRALLMHEDRDARDRSNTSCEHGVRLVVDEAFMDFADAESMAKEAVQSSQLICLSTFTKFFGMPGLRIGLCAGRGEATIAALRSRPGTLDRDIPPRTGSHCRVDRLEAHPERPRRLHREGT